MRKKLLYIFLLVFYLIIIFYGLIKRLNNEKSYAGYQKNVSTNVDVFIGEFRFTLFGYSSPNALVTFSGMGINDQTYADNNGYFEFYNRFSPLSPREACLTSQDQLGRISSPVCLPSFPTKYNVKIGPVLLPPTVSSNANNYYQGDEVRLSGQSIPNTELTFSAFINKKPLFFLLTDHLLSSVFAYTPSKLNVKTDEKGNYSLLLPSSHPESFRVFAQTSYDNYRSPESVKLNIKIYPVWMVIIHFFMLLWSIIKSRLLEIIIIGELIAIISFFLQRYLHPHIIAKNRALAIRNLYPLAKEETALIVPIKYPLAK